MLKLAFNLVIISTFASVVFTKPHNADTGFRKILQSRAPFLEDGLVNLWGKRLNFQNTAKNINIEEVETKYFPQKVDHYNPNDNRTFQMVRITNTVEPVCLNTFDFRNISSVLHYLKKEDQCLYFLEVNGQL